VNFSESIKKCVQRAKFPPVNYTLKHMSKHRKWHQPCSRMETYSHVWARVFFKPLCFTYSRYINGCGLSQGKSRGDIET